MNIDDINIRENTITSGFCCDFCINNQKFYADVSRVFKTGMIFKYKEDDTIDWSGVYLNENIDASKESLLQCVKEFAEQEFGL